MIFTMALLSAAIVCAPTDPVLDSARNLMAEARKLLPGFLGDDEKIARNERYDRFLILSTEDGFTWHFEVLGAEQSRLLTIQGRWASDTAAIPTPGERKDAVTDPETLRVNLEAYLKATGREGKYGNGRPTYEPSTFRQDKEGVWVRSRGAVSYEMTLLLDHPAFEGAQDFLNLALDPYDSQLLYFADTASTFITRSELKISEEQAIRLARDEALEMVSQAEPSLPEPTVELGYGLDRDEEARRWQAWARLNTEMGPLLARAKEVPRESPEGQEISDQVGALLSGFRREDGLRPLELAYRVRFGEIEIVVSATDGHTWQRFVEPQRSAPPESPAIPRRGIP